MLTADPRNDAVRALAAAATLPPGGDVDAPKARKDSSAVSSPRVSPRVSPRPSPRPSVVKVDDGMDPLLSPAFLEAQVPNGHSRKISAMDRHKEAVAERKRQQVNHRVACVDGACAFVTAAHRVSVSVIG